jgi:ribosomal protein L37AE/L43A
MSEAADERGAGTAGERQVPFYCPYCGDEDLLPAGPDGGAWACGSCARSFALRYVGLTTNHGGTW